MGSTSINVINESSFDKRRKQNKEEDDDSASAGSSLNVWVLFWSRDLDRRYWYISMSSSKDKMKSWFKYEVFLCRALILGLISPSRLEEVVLPILKQELPEDLLRRFASCLKSVVDTYRKEKPNSYYDEEFLEILDW